MKRAIILGMAAALLLAIPGTASAGDDEVRREGSCSAASEWEMRIKDEGNTLRVRWRVDSGIAGQTWRMRVFHDGELLVAANRTTNADGEATIDLRGVPDQAGSDQFSGRARNLASGETCKGSATL